MYIIYVCKCKRKIVLQQLSLNDYQNMILYDIKLYNIRCISIIIYLIKLCTILSWLHICNFICFTSIKTKSKKNYINECT